MSRPLQLLGLPSWSKNLFNFAPPLVGNKRKHFFQLPPFLPRIALFQQGNHYLILINSPRLLSLVLPFPTADVTTGLMLQGRLMFSTFSLLLFGFYFLASSPIFCFLRVKPGQRPSHSLVFELFFVISRPPVILPMVPLSFCLFAFSCERKGGLLSTLPVDAFGSFPNFVVPRRSSTSFFVSVHTSPPFLFSLFHCRLCAM